MSHELLYNITTPPQRLVRISIIYLGNLVKAGNERKGTAALVTALSATFFRFAKAWSAVENLV